MIAHSRLFVLVLAILAGAASVEAQQAGDLVVRGRVTGPEGELLEGQTVVLHRVQDAEGATVAEYRTSADGAFELRAPTNGGPDAIYFVATRYDGELYIAPPFRPGDGAVEQDLRVGIPGTSASAIVGTLPSAGGRPLTSRNWLLFVIPLIGAAAVAIYALVPRGRVPEHRALLIRIAEIDERAADATAGQAESLIEERGRLLARLGAD